MAQSLRKLWATSDHASTDVSRCPMDMCSPAEWCWWPESAWMAWVRACSSRRLETNRRNSSVMTTIRIRPPTNSARVDCQPSRTQMTMPSSTTRLVEANWKARADAAEEPFWKRLLAIAIAAYEHEEEAAPRPVAHPIQRAPDPPSACSIRSRGTQAWTMAEMAKPRTKAHHTAQAMRKASLKPLAMVVSMALTIGRPRHGGAFRQLVDNHDAHPW